MADLFARIAAAGMVPVVASEDAGHAVALADALTDGGLPVAEISFRTPAGAMARVAAERPGSFWVRARS